VDQFTSEYVYAEFTNLYIDPKMAGTGHTPPKALGYTALEDLAESAAVILRKGRKNTVERTIFFSGRTYSAAGG